MDKFERQITIRILTDNEDKLKNVQVNKAFNRIINSIQVAVEEGNDYIDAAQGEFSDNAEVLGVFIIR